MSRRRMRPGAAAIRLVARLRRFQLPCAQDLAPLVRVKPFLELPVEAPQVMVTAFAVFSPLRSGGALQDQSCSRRHEP